MFAKLTALFDQVESRSLSINELLFRTGDQVTSICLVDHGCIALERHLQTGTVTCLQRAVAGQFLAEASIYANHYHCDARALEPTRYRSLPTRMFKESLHADTQLADQWARHLSLTVQKTRFLSELRSIRTISDRLDMWVAEFGPIPGKGQWKSLAAELAVSPEALYRELSKRKAKRKLFGGVGPA